jgi:hypothetical protein
MAEKWEKLLFQINLLAQSLCSLWLLVPALVFAASRHFIESSTRGKREKEFRKGK